MTEHSLARELNEFADALNRAAKLLDPVTNHPAIRAIRLRGDQLAKFAPNAGEPTKWTPQKI